MFCGGRNKEPPSPYTFELVCSTIPPPTPPTVLRRLMCDDTLGLFDALFLDAVWFYDRPMDIVALKAALTALVTRFPALAGRSSSKGIVLNNEGARFSYCENYDDSATSYAGTRQPVRGVLADMPATAADGRGPLFTVRVTNFKDGTSSVGCASPHKLGDGKSFFNLVASLATTALRGIEYVDNIDFDAAAHWERAMPTIDRTQTKSGAAVIMPVSVLKTLISPFLGMFTSANETNMPRAKVHLTRSEMLELKNRVADTLGDGARVTVNEAISAALLIALKDTWPNFVPGRKATIQVTVNGQGKGLFKSTTASTAGELVNGNFSLVLHEQLPAPPETLTVTQAAAIFRKMGDVWRDDEQAAGWVELFIGGNRFMDLTGLMPTKGKYAPNIPTNMFTMNNQSTFPMAQICFAAGARLIGYTPWHSGDNLHIVAAVEPPDTKDVVRPGIVKQASMVKRMVGPAGNAQQAFARYDTDKSNSLSRAELKAALSKNGVDVADEREVDELLCAFDVDKDGALSARELDSAFFAARLAGGVDVYIPVASGGSLKLKAADKPARIAYLESAEFKERLLLRSETV